MTFDRQPPMLIHCSYHKCLTVYFGRVMSAVFQHCLPWRGYRHYNGDLEKFRSELLNGDFKVRSVNNHFLDRSELPQARISRFIRDPRDLVVSGYYYHRRGAEPWVNIHQPKAEDWRFANGCIPEALRDYSGSFASYLQEASKEDGLLAELAFRKNHFDSMALWPSHDPNTLMLRYEQLLGNEVASFEELFRFYGLTRVERTLGRFFAKRYAMSAQRVSKDSHVRNPSSQQWRQHFTPRVHAAFESAHPGLLEQLGYPAASD